MEKTQDHVSSRLEILNQASEPASAQYIQMLGSAVELKRGGNPAAEWRLRVNRQTAIHNRLMTIGPFAALACGSLLVLSSGSHVEPTERHSNWRDTLKDSVLYQSLDRVKQGQLTGLKRENWERLERAIQSFGHMIVLSAENMYSQALIDAFSIFKLRCVSHAIATDERLDQVLEYIKWIGKACQAAFLGIKIPQRPEKFSVIVNGTYLPFVGELSFVNDVLVQGRRTASMPFGSAAILAQLGNLPRALPYPSHDQVKADIKRTLDIIQTETVTPRDALTQYRIGLDILVQNIPGPKRSRSHVSLLGSGSYEKSRAEGGRAFCLVANARAFTDRNFEEFLGLVGKFDQFGKVLLNQGTVDIAMQYQKANSNAIITLGTLIYVPEHEAQTVLQSYFEKGMKVPRYLADILNLTASMLIREVGSYSPTEKYIENVMYFETREVIFKLEKPLMVKADVSIEAGMKSRMTTSAMSAFAHLSQLPANFMREYLSQDPFHRVGFQESDKLWEVLKTYRKLRAGVLG